MRIKSSMRVLGETYPLLERLRLLSNTLVAMERLLAILLFPPQKPPLATGGSGPKAPFRRPSLMAPTG
jgi:hypothetical protein